MGAALAGRSVSVTRRRRRVTLSVGMIGALFGAWAVSATSAMATPKAAGERVHKVSSALPASRASRAIEMLLEQLMSLLALAAHGIGR